MSLLDISFQGAARTVTGSRHRIRFGDHRWLFDCGIYQGHREEADRINRTFLEPPAALDTIVISHAHLDHIGNLPTAVHQGFAGTAHLTPATADLARVMLPDSAFLMEKDVDHVNRHHDRGRPPRRPLYTMEDVNTTLTRFETHAYRTPWDLFDGVRVEYWDAGHILGSALTVFDFAHNGRSFRLGMSGDLGRPDRRILRDPEVHPGVDALVLESTYGDRQHSPNDQTERELAEIMTRTLARGGRVLVPAFAVGRSQELVATVLDLMEQKRIPEVPVFVDSPLASEATQVFMRHTELWDSTDSRQLAMLRDPAARSRVRFVGSPQESRALNDRTDPCIIIAASGMCEGGRILHHLQHGLGNSRNTVLFVGYQGEGTLGRRLRDGAETVNIFGEPVMSRAEIASLDGFSAHADQHELLAWVQALKPAPRDIFLVHGEIGPMEILAGLLRERVGCTVHIPEKNQEFPLWT